MSDHFTLDIDPEGLRSVAARVGELREHLRTRGRRTQGTPGEIGDAWTGQAADRVKDEMTGLGGLMVRFGGDLQPVIEGLRGLARDYEDALDRLPELNRRWRAAETAYDDAVRIADNRMDRTRESLQENGTTINRAIVDELQTARSNAVDDAAATRRAEQRNLEVDFGYLKMWLRQQTRNLSKELSGAVPVPVTEDQLERWRNGEAAGLDFSGLFTRLELTRDRADLLAEQEERQLREAAREEVRADVANLQEALEDGDARRIQHYLDLIGGKVDDPPYYAEELVRELGPDGVNGLYAQIEGLVAGGTLVTEEIWPHFEGVNDVIARGMESLRPQDFAEFIAEFTDAEGSSDRLALLAASTHAGGQVAAATMAYYSNAYTSNHGALGPTFYPEVYHYAYGDDVGRQLELWDEKTTGADLAGFFQHLSEEDRQDLLDHLLVFAGSDVSHIGEDGWQRLAGLYGESLQAFRDQIVDVGDDSNHLALAGMETMLDYLWAPRSSLDADAYLPFVGHVVTDPEFWAEAAARGRLQAFDFEGLKNALDAVDADTAELMEAMVDLQLARGDDMTQIARNIGVMLRLADQLDQSVSFEGTLVHVLGKVPVLGEAVGLFSAVQGDLEAAEADFEDWLEQQEAGLQQHLLAFSLYCDQQGVPREFEDWLQDRGGSAQDPNAVIDWLLEQEREGTELSHAISELEGEIDDERF